MSSRATQPSTLATCCGRPMSTIAVTSPLAAPSATLALHTCASCGNHVWERDGAEVQGADILDAVKDRVAEGPMPRASRGRRSRPRPDPLVDLTTQPTVPAEVRERLKGFTPHGA